MQKVINQNPAPLPGGKKLRKLELKITSEDHNGGHASSSSSDSGSDSDSDSLDDQEKNILKSQLKTAQKEIHSAKKKIHEAEQKALKIEK